MASGNLELSIGGDRQYAFTCFDGYLAHHVLQRLIDHHGQDYEEWFRRTATSLLFTLGDRLIAPDHRAAIDVDRKRIDICAHSRFPAPGVKAALQRRGYTVIAHYDQQFLEPTREEIDRFLERIRKEFP